MFKRARWEIEPDLLQIVQTLQQEKIVLGDSDTVLGLLAKATAGTKNKLDSIKERTNKPYLVFVGSIEQARDLMGVEELEKKGLLESVEGLMKQCWPGPLTIIVPAAPEVPDYLVGPNKTIGLRVPDHKGLLNVLKDIPYLFSTSANKASKPVPVSIQEVDPAILNQVALLVSGEESTNNQPSTIIDCSGDTIMVIREGAYPLEKLKKYLV